MPAHLSFFLFIVMAVQMSGSSARTEWKISYELESETFLTIGVLPYKEVDQITAELNPLTKDLGGVLDRTVVIKVASSYENLAHMLSIGIVDIAWFSRTSFEIIQMRKHFDWRVLCEPVLTDKNGYRGVIVTLVDHGIASLDDLTGKIFAYVDRHSGTGFMYPNFVLKKAGISPLNFFKEVVFTGSHSESLHGLFSGKYDAAAVYDDLIDELDPETRKKILILEMTDWISTDPIVVRGKMDEGLFQTLQKYFLTLENRSAGKSVLSSLKSSRNIVSFKLPPAKKQSGDQRSKKTAENSGAKLPLPLP